MLEARNISVGYGKKSVFNNVSLKLKTGDIYCIHGPSGCGKTTLGRVLANLHKADTGTVRFNDKTADDYQIWPVQYLFQSPIHAMNSRWRINRIIAESGGYDHAHAKRLGVRDEWMERFPHELSGGQLQRISIMRALGAKPKFLIADEITAALDPIAQAQIWKLLIHLSKEHDMGILAISHDHDLLKQITPEQNYLSFITG